MEMHSLFEKYLGNPTASNTTPNAQAKGKGVLRGPPPGFPAKDPLESTSTFLETYDSKPT